MDIATILTIVIITYFFVTATLPSLERDSVAVVTGGSLSSPGQLTSAAQLSVVCAEASPASTGLCGSTELVPKARKAPQHLEAPRTPQSPAPRGHCSPERGSGFRIPISVFLLTSKSLPRRKMGVSQKLAPQLPQPFRWDSQTSDISAVLSRLDNTHHTSDQ